MTFRVGRQVGTTIYRDDEAQPCAWVPNDPALAARIVELLNQSTDRQARPFTMPDYCGACGAFLMGGATEHKPDCKLMEGLRP